MAFHNSNLFAPPVTSHLNSLGYLKHLGERDFTWRGTQEDETEKLLVLSGVQTLVTCLAGKCFIHNTMPLWNLELVYFSTTFITRKKKYFILFSRMQLLKPGDKAQSEMIVASIAEILLRLAEGRPAVFCLAGSDNCFEPTANFAIDGVTEKVSGRLKHL